METRKKIERRRTTHRIAGCLGSALLACLVPALAAASSDYPKRPIQVVVPYGPGGVVDVVSRVVAEHMGQTLGQPVIIQNRPGANANIGPSLVSTAAPDGYTLLASSSSTVVNPMTEKNIGWGRDSFTPIARVAQSPNLLVVPASSQISTLAEFVTMAKAKPGLATPVTGFGSSQSLARENFARAANIGLLNVAYKGGVSFVSDLLSGTLAMSVSPINVVLRLVKDGQLTALANTAEERSPLLPNVPTMREAGYPEATAVSWFGFHAPAGTPHSVLAKLSQAVRAAAENEQVKARIAAMGAEIAYLDTPEFERFLGSEAIKAEKYVAAIGVAK